MRGPGGRGARALDLWECGRRRCAVGECGGGSHGAEARVEGAQPAEDWRGDSAAREAGEAASCAGCGIGVSAHCADREDIPLAHRLLPGEVLCELGLSQYSFPSSGRICLGDLAPHFPFPHSGTFLGNAFGFSTLFEAAETYPEVIFLGSGTLVVYFGF